MDPSGTGADPERLLVLVRSLTPHGRVSLTRVCTLSTPSPSAHRRRTCVQILYLWVYTPAFGRAVTLLGNSHSCSDDCILTLFPQEPSPFPSDHDLSYGPRRPSFYSNRPGLVPLRDVWPDSSNLEVDLRDPSVTPETSSLHRTNLDSREVVGCLLPSLQSDLRPPVTPRLEGMGRDKTKG